MKAEEISRGDAEGMFPGTCLQIFWEQETFEMMVDAILFACAESGPLYDRKKGCQVWRVRSREGITAVYADYDLKIRHVT